MINPIVDLPGGKELPEAERMLAVSVGDCVAPTGLGVAFGGVGVG